MSNDQTHRLVEDLMVKDVATISCMATLRDAMEKMRARKVKSLVVEKRHDSDAWGLVTYSAILRTIIEEDGDIDLVNVYDIATRPVLTVPRQLEVRHAVSMMLRFDIRRLVVSSNNELEGVLTMNDIVSEILDKLDD
ncbi:MAG: CBS domain-containing protein [Wenzhouxiangella sp.]|jgi:signal-transduction protein with cAMP-binding, CBS, and nucleotidyltransferase domain|nr:CBS domain-containing protein [Wenzhouxiangella sp.]